MDDRWTLYRWRPRWRIFRAVRVEQWRVRPLDGWAETTGAYFDVTLLRWLWIRFLGLLLGSRTEAVRTFAGRRWSRMRVTYNYPRSFVGRADWTLADLQRMMVNQPPGEPGCGS